MGKYERIGSGEALEPPSLVHIRLRLPQSF